MVKWLLIFSVKIGRKDGVANMEYTSRYTLLTVKEIRMSEENMAKSCGAKNAVLINAIMIKQ